MVNLTTNFSYGGNMERRILIISSNVTGHGHKSITDSLLQRFAFHDNVKVTVVDGFSLKGKVSMNIGKLYGPMTRNAKDIWKLVWEVSLRNPELLTEITEVAIKENMLALLADVKPDLILSVHPNFNSSVLNILKNNNIDIPFVTLIADLVSITPLWADKRVNYILCPTIESKEKCLEFGVAEEKLILSGFPIRKKFCEDLIIPERKPFDNDKVINCLIMSGGEGSGNMSRIAKILLNHFNTRVTIVTGRNKALKARLEETLYEKYGKRVQIYGFVDEIQDLMVASDIAFTRGSPNTMLEAVYCNVPLVITGALPGQEEMNPWYMEKYGLGIICNETKNIRSTVESLVTNNGKLLNDIRENQKKYRNPNISKEIVDFLLSIKPGKGYNPPIKKKKLIAKIKSVQKQ